MKNRLKKAERERERERETKTPLKPFSASFWKLLGGALLGLALIFGGIVWATFTDDSYCANSDLCIKMGVKGAKTPQDKPADVRKTFELKPRKTDGTVDTTSAMYNKRLRITSEDDKEHFIPLRTKAEIVSFLKAIQTNSENTTMAGKFTVCSPNGQITIGDETVEACASENSGSFEYCGYVLIEFGTAIDVTTGQEAPLCSGFKYSHCKFADGTIKPVGSTDCPIRTLPYDPKNDCGAPHCGGEQPNDTTPTNTIQIP